MISFETLEQKHFSCMLKWLESPHVKAWWDSNIHYTLDSIAAKYTPYIHNPILQAYIITVDKEWAGYIQMYKTSSFPYDSDPPFAVPENTGAFDMLIGEIAYVGRGIGSQALSLFIERYMLHKFDYIIVNPEKSNIVAIKSYKKAGLKIISEDDKTIWMLTQNRENSIILS